MALEKSNLEEIDIRKILNEEYGIQGIRTIDRLNQGSSNVFKIESDLGNYILKEYNSDRRIDSIEKEINVVEYLRSKNLSVPFFRKRIDSNYISIYHDKIITLQDFIDGHTIENNTGDNEKVIQSARILGSIVKELKDYKDLNEEQCMEKMFSKHSLERTIKIIEREYEDIRPDNKYRGIYIKDLQDKINMGKYLLSNFDFELLNNVTVLGTHGDFSVRQLIYADNNDVAVIDFETARKMPITWEIMRSYSYIDKKAKNAEFDINNLVNYYKEFDKYVSLNENDLRYAPHIYLLQLVCSPFGYREYNKDNSQEKLLKFGQFRTELCRYLFRNADNIGKQLLLRIKNKEKDIER